MNQENPKASCPSCGHPTFARHASNCAIFDLQTFFETRLKEEQALLESKDTSADPASVKEYEKILSKLSTGKLEDHEYVLGTNFSDKPELKNKVFELTQKLHSSSEKIHDGSVIDFLSDPEETDQTFSPNQQLKEGYKRGNPKFVEQIFDFIQRKINDENTKGDQHDEVRLEHLRNLRDYVEKQLFKD